MVGLLVYKGNPHLEADDRGVPPFQETSILWRTSEQMEIWIGWTMMDSDVFSNAAAGLCGVSFS